MNTTRVRLGGFAPKKVRALVYRLYVIRSVHEKLAVSVTAEFIVMVVEPLVPV